MGKIKFIYFKSKLDYCKSIRLNYCVCKEHAQASFYALLMKTVNPWVIKTPVMGSGEKHHKYIGFRYVIRVFLMVFFSMLMYLMLGTLGSFS